MCPVLQQASRLKIFSTLLVNPGSANNLKQSDAGFAGAVVEGALGALRSLNGRELNAYRVCC